MVLENINFPQLGTQMGGSAVLGGIIGFAAKKLAKVIAAIIGVELALFKFLESRGVLEVNWARLANASAQVSNQAEQAGQTIIEAFVATAGIGGSFAAGFLVGFRRA
jgi:uncharacterized membrane protein (Fun14 family)